ncbi:hypothetical protein CCMSSC00406_0005986 [Pleurotus cornucopiae]|uniref:Uncharacterized protein n=1 Tax=Pleurotus cornucopiae TaxID=5321 RepID=A0ACB7IND5_PLECO|nr:hypothetical protein CCMSSC00406_0005986 [Pleurotus cornucopiae]
MEELYIAQPTFTTAGHLRPERPKVHLSHLRFLSIGRYQDSLSELLDMLIIPHPIEFLAWGTGDFHELLDLPRTFLPAQLGESKLAELRVSSIIAPYHPSSIFPRRGYTIISNGDRLQVDGRLEPHNFLLAVPRYIVIGNVTQLWLGIRFQEDPSLEEWRGFFRTVPLVVTLVISRRSSFQILFALTLNPKKENQSRDLLSLPELETIRIFADRNLSVQILSQFAQQRARLGKRLKTCEIIANGKQHGAHWGEHSDAAAVPASAPRTPANGLGPSRASVNAVSLLFRKLLGAESRSSFSTMENSTQIDSLPTIARQLSDEELDVLETNIQRAMIDVRLLKNERLPINTLLPEILAKIFEDLVDMEMRQDFLPLRPAGDPRSRCPFYKQPPVVYVVSAVCRVWRDVTIGFPQLWSSICQQASCRNKLFNLNLERSQSTPLRIFLHKELLTRDTTPTTAELIARLAPCHAERIRQLRLSSISLTSCALLNALALPNLECLTLKNIRNHLHTTDFPLTIFDTPTPHLKQLTLLNCPFFSNQTFSGLTHLCFACEYETSAWPLDYFLNVLRASPQLEELYVAQCPFPVRTECSRVLLGCLRILSLGKYRESLSDLLDMLSIPHPIEFLAWGTDAVPKLQHILSALYPAQPSEQVGSISELRVTAITAPAHPSSIFPNPGYTIISNKGCLQIDGRFTKDETLFAVPQYIDVSNVTDLWLAAPFLNEPSMEEWRRFLKTVPAVVTLVVGHRSSTPILSALTLLSDEETCEGYNLLLPKLEAIRIFADRNLSIKMLSLFAEQRARLGSKLKTCDVTAELGPSTLRHGWGQGWVDPGSWPIWDPLEHEDSLDGRGDDFASLSNAVPGLEDPTADDLKDLREYIDEVDYSKVAIDPLRSVLETPAWDWVERLWTTEDSIY